MFMNLRAKRRWVGWAGLSLLSGLAAAGDAPNGARIFVAAEGLIRFPAIRLQALGVDLAAIDPETLQLTLRGQLIPLRLEAGAAQMAPGDTLEFLALPPIGGRANYDIYRLSWAGSPGLDLPTLPPLAVEGATVFDRIEAELPLKPIEGHLTAPRRYGISVQLPPDLEPGAKGRLQLELEGVSQLTNDPDHHLVVKINQREVGDLRWDGPIAARFESEIAAGILVPGSNRIELSLPGDIPGLEPGQPAYDGIRMTAGLLRYETVLQPVRRGLAFELAGEAPGRRLLRAAGDDVEQPLWIYSSNGYRVAFRPLAEGGLGAVDYAIAGARSYLAGPDSAVEPEFIEPTFAAELPFAALDYVLIAPVDLFEAGAALARYRSEQGLAAVAVRAEAIYDRYSHSYPAAEALRDYLVELRRRHPPGPRFVTLMGDARKDYLEWRGFSAGNLVPTFSIPVAADEINASDTRIVDLEGEDGIPEISIGRLPARSAAEARRMVEKIQSYEQSAAGSWLARALFVTGLPKFGGEINPFVRSSEELIVAAVPAGLRREKLFLERSLVRDPRFVTDRVPDPQATKKILQLFNQGLGLAHYSGHGGLNVWEDRQLLTLEDVPGLKNGERLPLVISMSCFTAYFDDTELGCIGEELVNARGGGAIAFWGSSGRSSMHGNFQLSELVFRALFETQIETVGQLFDAVKARYLDAGGNRQMADAYVLLGDPALQLKLPRPTLKLTAAPVPGAARLRLEGRSARIASGTGDVVLEDAAGHPVAQAALALEDHVVSGEIHLDGLAPGRYEARAVVWSDGSRRPEVGALELYRAVPEIVLEPLPEAPFRDQPLRPAVQLRWDQPLAQVKLLWSWDRQNWQEKALRAEAEGRYVSESELAPPLGRQTLFFKVQVRDGSGSESETAEQMIAFRDRADLGLRALRTEVGAPVRALLRNAGDEATEAVAVELRLIDGTDGGSLLSRQTVAPLPPRGQTTVDFPGLDLPATAELQILVDPDRELAESNTANNKLSVRLRLPAGSRWHLADLNGGAGADFRVAGTNAPRPSQPALVTAALEGWACEVEALRAEAQGPVRIAFDRSEPSLDVFRWSKPQRQWVAVRRADTSESGALQAEVPGAGVYAVLESRAASAPRVELFREAESDSLWALIVEPNGLDLDLNPPRLAAAPDRPLTWYGRPGNGAICLVQLPPEPSADTLVVTGFDGREHRLEITRP